MNDEVFFNSTGTDSANSNGLAENLYSEDLIDGVVTLEDLFLQSA